MAGIVLFFEHRLDSTSIGLLSQLHNLNLNSNRLTGVIPTSIAELTNIHYLYLVNNALQGSIPTSFGQLGNLMTLGLSLNRLNSSIPTTLGLLGSLKFLLINDNQLTSWVPSQLVHLSLLVGLTLENNKLSGVFPVESCKPTFGFITMTRNNLACVPWCQDDYDWLAMDVTLPRCQDFQYVALAAIELSLGVLSTLQSHATLRSTSRIIQSPHPSTEYFLYVNDANAYEYVVEMIMFDMIGKLSFCVDSSCNNVIGQYDPSGWAIPSGATSLAIKHASFYVSFQYDYTVSLIVNGVYQVYSSNGFTLTLTSRLRDKVGWTFMSSPSYQTLNPLAASPSLVYAKGLCQWDSKAWCRRLV